MLFVKVDPEKDQRELEELAKTEEGARLIRYFVLEFEFRDKLIEARRHAKLSQAEISRRSGLKQQAVSRLENGYQDGKNYDTKHYNLKAIIAVDHKVNSERAMQFRKCSTDIIEEFTINDYVMDYAIIKNGVSNGNHSTYL